MNTSNIDKKRAYLPPDDFEDFGYLDTQSFKTFARDVHKAIKRMGCPTTAEVKQHLGDNCMAERVRNCQICTRIFSAFQYLEAEGILIQQPAGNRTRWTVKQAPVVVKRDYNSTVILRKTDLTRPVDDFSRHTI